MFFTGLGTAVPATRYGQDACWEALRASPRFAALSGASRTLLQRVLLGDSGIRTRHLALASLEEAFDLDPDVLHRRFAACAPELAAHAAREALERAATGAEEIDAILV